MSPLTFPTYLRHARVVTALLSIAAIGSTALAQTNGDWAVDASGNWSDAANWSTDPSVPGGAESTINLDFPLTADVRTVTIDTDDRTLGILNMGSGSFRRYTLDTSGGSNLILDNAASAAQINFLSGNNNSVNAPLILNSSLTINNATNNAQSITGGTITAGSAGAKTITNNGSGSGTVTLLLSGVDNTTADLGLAQLSSTSTLFLSAPGSDQVQLVFGNGIEVDGGTLSLRFNVALGSSDLYLNNASLLRPGTSGGSSASGNVSLGGAVSFNSAESGTGQLTMSGTVDLHADTNLSVYGNTLSITAPISGAHSLTKSGSQLLSLSSSSGNSFSGGFIQSEGRTLAMNNAGLLGTGPVTMSGGELELRWFNSGLNFGNDVVVNGDSKLTSTRSNADGTGSTHTLGTLEIGSQTLTMGVNTSATTTGTQGLTFTATTVTGDATLHIENGTLTTGQMNLGALSGAGSLTKTGPGVVNLTAAAATYSGTTTVEDGTLNIGNASALGATALIINGGTAIAPSGGALSNTSITLGGGTYLKNFANAESFSNTLATTSSFDGGIVTGAEFLDGAAGGVRAVSTAFSLAPAGAVGNDSIRSSDVFTLSGTQSDIFVLQLTTADISTANFLGWVEDGVWVNAIDGNSTLGGSAVQGFVGSYAAAGISANSDYLGSWGVDADGNSVWAILDHNSEFAVIPEPATISLLLALCALALTGMRKIRR